MLGVCNRTLEGCLQVRNSSEDVSDRLWTERILLEHLAYQERLRHVR